MPISVAMATYNGAKFLRQQLESLASQILQPAELVVSDDGSSDATVSIVQDFAKTVHFPVRLIAREQHDGFADNFFSAAGACREDFIAFCDQDDVWLPTKLQLGFERLIRDDSLLAMHRLTISDENLNPIGVWEQGIVADTVFDPLVLDPYITGWGNSMLFRRELLTVILPGDRPRQPESPERPLSHDTWIYVLAAALGRVSHVMEPLVRYRQHGTNAMGLKHSTAWQRLGTKLSAPINRFQEQGLFNAHMARLFGICASQTGNAFCDRARVAQQRFVERSNLLAVRMDVYQAGSVLDRFKAFQALRQAPRHPPVGMRSYVKDFVLGVGGAQALFLLR